jgi:hypothetical protein
MLSLKAQGKIHASRYLKNYFNDLFTKKRKLVKLEIDLIDRVQADWQTILESTVTDRVKAEISIRDCYRYAGLNPPSIIWADRPLNVIKILINRPDLCDISDLFISELWQSELEIQKSIDPDAVKYVLSHLDPHHPLDILTSERQIGSISERANEIVMTQANKIYCDLTEKTIPAAFQNYDTGYLGYFDYFWRIGVNIPYMQPAIDLAKSCGWCWTFEKLVILTPKPSQVTVDRLGNIIAIIYNDVNILNELS